MLRSDISFDSFCILKRNFLVVEAYLVLAHNNKPIIPASKSTGIKEDKNI